MVQRSPALTAPPPLPSLTPADALGAVLRHLHRSGVFPPGTLLLVGPMVAFVSFLEKRPAVFTDRVPQDIPAPWPFWDEPVFDPDMNASGSS